MKKKFFKGLPIYMIDHLLKTRWVTAKHTPLEMILEEEKVMECSTQSFNLYKERQSHSSHNDMERSGNNNNTDSPTQTCQVVRFIKKTKWTHLSGGSHS